MNCRNEFSKVWRNDHYKEIELLSASFKDFRFNKHWHNELAIGLILQGSEGLDYRGGKITIPQGYIVAINPAEIHTGFSGSDVGWTYRMFYFDTGLINEILSEYQQYDVPYIKGPIIDDPELFQDLYQLHIAMEKSSFRLTRESLLTLAIYKLLSHHGETKPVLGKIYKDTVANKQVRDYLLNCWQDNISLDDLSQLNGRSKYQLIRSFNLQYGVTPHQFSLLVKVLRAKDLLKAGRNCVESALECGFFDQSHMTRIFKRTFGITPSQYRYSLIGSQV